MTNVLVDNTSLTSIANAIRSKNGTNTTYKPAQMDDAINALNVFKPSSWSRPSSFPDYSQLDISEDEVIYLTYDTSYDSMWISVRVYGAYTIKRGSLSNGVFTAATSTNCASGDIFRENLPTNAGAYVVYQITPQSGSSLTRFEFARKDDENSSTYFQSWQQPCVERYCSIPNWVGTANRSNNQYTWSTRYIVADTVMNAIPTSLVSAYSDGGFSLEYLDMSTCSFADVTTMANFAFNQYNLTYVYLPDDLSSKCTTLEGVFRNVYNIHNLDLSGWNTSGVTKFARCFDGCRMLSEIKGIEDFDFTSATDISYMFENCNVLQDIDTSDWVIGSSVTNLAYLFYNCYFIKSLSVNTWNVTNVTSFAGTFGGCTTLKELNISNWEVTTKATDMNTMFGYCRELRNLNWDTSSWDTKNVTNFSSMFRECRELLEIDVSDFDTSSATNVSYMFNHCNKLTSFDISNFDLTKVTTLNNSDQFASNCWLLKNVTLPSTKVTKMPDFEYCYYLEKLVIPSTVNEIGRSHLRNLEHCYLLDFRNHTSVPTLSAYTDITNGWNSKIKIVVPDSLYSTWTSTAQWNNATLVAAIVSASTYEASLA